MRVVDTNSFIAKSKTVHNDTYDYSCAIYKGNKTKLKINCKEHGKFEQLPYNHVKGMGCPKCSLKRVTNKLKMDTAGFIEKANKVHNNLYNYTKTVYVINKTKLKIICKVHGEFKQFPGNHLSGMGCPECGKVKISLKAKIDTEEFIKRANKVHGKIYDYSLSEYKGYKNKLTIICKKHGKFIQSPDAHLEGCGCQLCGTSKRLYTNYKDWEYRAKESEYFDSFKLYIIELKGDNETFYKFGITYNKIERRISRIPYNANVIKVIEGNAKHIFNLEQNIHKISSRYYPLIKFGGHSECFSNIEEISSFINKLETKNTQSDLLYNN